MRGGEKAESIKLVSTGIRFQLSIAKGGKKKSFGAV